MNRVPVAERLFLRLDERRLQQLFHADEGLSPRSAGRLAPAWAELAVEAGYHDQVHLANEFRARAA